MWHSLHSSRSRSMSVVSLSGRVTFDSSPDILSVLERCQSQTSATLRAPYEFVTWPWFLWTSAAVYCLRMVNLFCLVAVQQLPQAAAAASPTSQLLQRLQSPSGVSALRHSGPALRQAAVVLLHARLAITSTTRGRGTQSQSCGNVPAGHLGNVTSEYNVFVEFLWTVVREEVRRGNGRRLRVCPCLNPPKHNASPIRSESVSADWGLVIPHAFVLSLWRF